jgi:hypothetical protein
MGKKAVGNKGREASKRRTRRLAGKNGNRSRGNEAETVNMQRSRQQVKGRKAGNSKKAEMKETGKKQNSIGIT